MPPYNLVRYVDKRLFHAVVVYRYFGHVGRMNTNAIEILSSMDLSDRSKDRDKDVWTTFMTTVLCCSTGAVFAGC